MKTDRTAGAAAAALLILCGACTADTGDNTRTEAQSLYRQQLELTNLFIDSINRAPDSTRLLELYDRFAERMTDCNLDYRPDTDLKILEGENEQLAMALDSLVRLKEKKLYSYAHPDTTTTKAPETTVPAQPAKEGEAAGKRAVRAD